MATVKELEARVNVLEAELVVAREDTEIARRQAKGAAEDLAKEVKARETLRPFVLTFTEGKAPNARDRALVMVMGKPANMPSGYRALPKEAGIDGFYFSSMQYTVEAAGKRITADLPDAVSDEAYEEMVRAEMERRIAERLAERKRARTTA